MQSGDGSPRKSYPCGTASVSQDDSINPSRFGAGTEIGHVAFAEGRSEGDDGEGQTQSSLWNMFPLLPSSGDD